MVCVCVCVRACMAYMCRLRCEHTHYSLTRLILCRMFDFVLHCTISPFITMFIYNFAFLFIHLVPVQCGFISSQFYTI